MPLQCAPLYIDCMGNWHSSYGDFWIQAGSGDAVASVAWLGDGWKIVFIFSRYFGLIYVTVVVFFFFFLFYWNFGYFISLRLIVWPFVKVGNVNLQIVLLPTESNIYLYLEIQKYIVVDGTSERWRGGRVWGGKKSSVADRQKKNKNHQLETESTDCAPVGLFGRVGWLDWWM